MNTSSQAEGAVHAPQSSVPEDRLPLTRGIPSRKGSGRWIASAPLVGRAAILAALSEPTRIAAIIRGEPGIGKSRLLAEIRSAYHSQTFAVACMSAGLAISHEPLVALVRSLHQFGRLADDSLENVVHARERDRLWYLHDAFAQAASFGPLVVQFDDLQFADKRTLEALQYCIGRLQDLPIRWQLATRPGNADVLEFLLALERAGLMSVIELDGLECDDLRLLVASLRPELAFDDAGINELHRLTAGNPLYAELLLTAKDWNATTLPGDLRVALAQRFSTLSQQALDIAGWLAVENGSVSDSTLAALASVSVAQVQQTLSELSDNYIITLTDYGAFFRHDLLRGSCYGLLSEDERVAHHRALARRAKNPWHQAMHLEGAREFEKAARLFNEIGWRSLDHHAPTEALNAYKHALQWLAPESLLAREAQGGCAAALFRLGQVAEAKETMAAFEERATPLTPAQRVRVRRHYVEAAWDESDDYDYIKPILTLALEEARRFEKQALPGLLCVLGSIDERQGELQLARQTLEEGIQLCDPRFHQRELIRLRGWLGVTYARFGDVAKGIELLEKAASDANLANLSNELAQCCTKLCYVTHMAGDWEGYRHWCRVGLETRGPKSKTTEALLKSNLASAAVDRGDLHEALGLALSVEPYISDGNVHLRCKVLTDQAQIYAMLGDFEMAEHVVQTCATLEFPPATRRLAHFTAGFVAELHERYAQALGSYSAAIASLATDQIREVYEMRALTGIVRTLCLLKEKTQAEDGLARLQQVASSGWPQARLSLREARGCYALLSGEHEKAASEFLAASSGQYPFWRAHLELMAAVASEDRRLFLEAIDLFDSIGAGVASDRARALARSRGFRPGRKRETHGTLSAREMSVAFFVANGKTNAEIGDVLHVSSRTVEYHISNILSKCGLRSRVEIATKIAAGKSLESAS